MEEVNISMINAENLIYADFAFSGCKSLKNVYLPDKMSHLKSTKNMFEDCSNLKTIDLEFLRMSPKLNDFNSMFKGCSNLTEVNFPNIEIQTIFLSMANMFSECSNLKNVNMKGLIIPQIMYMESMFSGCKNLQRINIYNLNTFFVIAVNFIFEGVEKKVEVEYNPKITGLKLQEEIKKIQENKNMIK